MPVQPIFYTLLKDIYNAWDSEVEQVVICELDAVKNGQHRNLQDIVNSHDFTIKKAHKFEKLLHVSLGTRVESVLIVPLGTFPMIATQLYTLLKEQEGRNIHEVILVYPAQATDIVSGAELIEKALQEEANVPSCHAVVPELEDIDSEEACWSYRNILEEVIDQARDKNPGCGIDLALSGGRKGMTAMTIFAAQKKQLSYVYHTLITDKQLSEEIDKQTTVEKLTDMRKKERHDCLFLRTYNREGLEPKFVLFKVPVFAAQRQADER